MTTSTPGAKPYPSHVDRHRHVPKPPPALLDLTALCRDKSAIETNVLLSVDSKLHEWIKLGQCRMVRRESSRQPGRWELAAYLSNATDFEHDSAFVLKLELVGVEFGGVSYGVTTFTGWIKGDDPEDFRVPDPGYNPLKHPGATKCREKACNREPHIIVPEGFYVPPPNPELLALVAGFHVEVRTGRRGGGD